MKHHKKIDLPVSGINPFLHIDFTGQILAVNNHVEKIAGLPLINPYDSFSVANLIVTV